MLMTVSAIFYITLYAISLRLHLNSHDLGYTIHAVMFIVLFVPWLAMTQAAQKKLPDFRVPSRLVGAAVFLVLVLVAMGALLSFMFYSCCVQKRPTEYVPAKTVVRKP